MRIMIVDDQPDKGEQLKEFIFKKIGYNTIIVDKESLRGALKEVVKNSEYDYILLDMSMPNFDPSDDNPADSSPASFAGKELLEQMKLRNIKIPVIVITQYSSFEGGAVTLDQLSEEFAQEYSDFYIGSIYFNSADDIWKEQLYKFIRGSNG